MSVLKEETLEENIENWIIKKTFLQKKIDEETRSRRDKVDSSSQEVIKTKKENSKQHFRLSKKERMANA